MSPLDALSLAQFQATQLLATMAEGYEPAHEYATQPTWQLMQAQQALSQQQAAFDLLQSHEQRVFRLKMVMAWSAYYVLLGFNIIVAAGLLDLDTPVPELAAGAVFAQTLGVSAWLWRTIGGHGAGALAATTPLPGLGQQGTQSDR